MIPFYLLVSDDYYVAFITFVSRTINEWLMSAVCKVIDNDLRDQDALDIASKMISFNYLKNDIFDILYDAHEEDYYTDSIWYLAGAWEHNDIEYWQAKLNIDFIEDDYSNITEVTSSMLQDLIHDPICLKALGVIGYPIEVS
jgi:hypothetical protein